MSLVKYHGDKDGNGRGNFWWGRADKDGLPFRGRQIPNYKEEEFEDRLVIVGDAKAELFDVTEDNETRQRYLEVVDRIVNGWYVCLHREHHFSDGKMLVYIEWVERCVEDRNPNEQDAVSSHLQDASQSVTLPARRSITEV